MYIVHIASELAPIAKVGGLADVIYGLAKETVKSGHKVEILIPKYDNIHYKQLRDLQVERREVWTHEGPHRYHNTIWAADIEELRVLLIEPHHPNYYFGRGTIYGCHDDIDRFCYFCRAAMEYLFKTGKHPDIVHIHDWPTSLIAPLYKDIYNPLGLRIGGIVLTIHNLEHQGKCSTHNLTRIGLKGENYLTPEKMQDPFNPTTINLLKGGIEYSNFVTTVSPTYQKEIKTVEGGCGLHETLIKHEQKMEGILNGIDEAFWNPEKDLYLAKNYATHHMDSSTKITKVTEGKAANKHTLRTHLNLSHPADPRVPIVTSITRLVPQKSPHLIKHALMRTLEKGYQFVLLGSPMHSEIEREFRQLKKDLSANNNVAICLDQDEALAHLIYAGADLFVIPSLFEPCGLTQMIALRYGTVPLARLTGGLADTVFDVDTASCPSQERNGYTFDFPDEKGVNWALDRALDCCMHNPTKWHTLMQQGMNRDLSWKQAAQRYLTIYEEIL